MKIASKGIYEEKIEESEDLSLFMDELDFTVERLLQRKRHGDVDLPSEVTQTLLVREKQRGWKECLRRLRLLPKKRDAPPIAEKTQTGGE